MKRVPQIAAVLGVTALLLVLFTRGIAVDDVWRAIAAADVRMLVAAQAAALGAYVLRARRWQFLLRHLGSTRFLTALKATVIGFSASFLLPGRTGEFVRPYLLARRERLNLVATIATIVVERLLDLLGVLLLFGVVAVFAHPAAAPESTGIFRAMKVGGLAAGAASLAAFALLVFFARFPAHMSNAIRLLTAWMPRRVSAKVVGLAATFADGLTILRDRRDAAIALAGALPLWLCSAASIWCTSEAFRLGIPPSGAVMLMIFLVLGIAVPTPGGVGSVHYAFRFGATALYSAADDRAVGAAIVFHAMTVVPVSLVGLLLAALEGLNVRGLRQLASTPGPAPDRIEPAV